VQVQHAVIVGLEMDGPLSVELEHARPIPRRTGICRLSWYRRDKRKRDASARDHQSRPRFLQRLSSRCLKWWWTPPILGRWCSKKVHRGTKSWREWWCVYGSPYRERGEVTSPWWELSERQRDGRLRVEHEEHAQHISQPLLWDLMVSSVNEREATIFSF
jgi:hypothetical protein